MTKPDILMIGPYPEWDLKVLKEHFNVHKYWLAEDKDAFSATIAEKVRGIATRGELGASKQLMSKFPKLEIVSCYGVGVDGIDLHYAKDHNIRITNTPDVLTGDVADIGIALLLCVARQIPKADSFVRSQAWKNGNMNLVTRVFGKKVGIVGMGRIGEECAKRLSGFDCEISYYNRSAKKHLSYRYYSDLIALACECDFLIVTIAGGEGTKNIVNKDVIDALGSDGILVNISRGTTIDEAALIEALEKGAIKGAGLEVFLNEPNIDKRFLTMDNVVLQPHHGSGTVETRKAMGKLVCDNLIAYFSSQQLLTPIV